MWHRLNSKQNEGHMDSLAGSDEPVCNVLAERDTKGELYKAHLGVVSTVTDIVLTIYRDQLTLSRWLSNLYNTTLDFNLDIAITFDTTFRLSSF